MLCTASTSVLCHIRETRYKQNDQEDLDAQDPSVQHTMKVLHILLKY